MILTENLNFRCTSHNVITRWFVRMRLYLRSLRGITSYLWSMYVNNSLSFMQYSSSFTQPFEPNCSDVPSDLSDNLHSVHNMSIPKVPSPSNFFRWSTLCRLWHINLNFFYDAENFSRSAVKYIMSQFTRIQRKFRWVR